MKHRNLVANISEGDVSQTNDVFMHCQCDIL